MSRTTILFALAACALLACIANADPESEIVPEAVLAETDASASAGHRHRHYAAGRARGHHMFCKLYKKFQLHHFARKHCRAAARYCRWLRKHKHAKLAGKACKRAVKKWPRAIGTHNSYHIQPGPYVLGALHRLGMGAMARAFSYTHPPLAHQSKMGLTTFEIDVLADPNGGRWAHPKVQHIPKRALGIPAPGGLESKFSPREYKEMMKPGYKVLHVQDLDTKTHCHTFKKCLKQIASGKKKGKKKPIYVLIEIKDKSMTPHSVPAGPLGTFHFTKGLAMTGKLWKDLEKEAAPFKKQGIKFMLDNPAQSASYIKYKGKGKRKVFMPNIAEMKRRPKGWGRRKVFFKCNNPTSVCSKGMSARQIVKRGYLVRTRADTDLQFNAKRAAAAFKSGAQVIHTDAPANMMAWCKKHKKC